MLDLANSLVITQESSIKDELLLCNHTTLLDDLSVLAHNDRKPCLEIKQSLLIKADKLYLEKHLLHVIVHFSVTYHVSVK